MQLSNLGICVADGHHYVRENADWVTDSIGGQGAVREIADLLLFSQDKLDSLHKAYLS